MEYFRVLSVILLLQFITACTSYKYEYIPPQDLEGQKSIKSCLNHNWTCISNCHSDYSHCISSSGINITINSIGQIAHNQHYQSQRCDRAKSDCMTSCNGFYNDCYRESGGIINIYQIN